MCEWERDTESFKFKVIHKLECEPINIELLMECLDNNCENEIAVHGTIMVDGRIFKKIEDEVKGKHIKEAKNIMIIKALEVADVFALQTEHNSDYMQVQHSLGEILQTVLKDPEDVKNTETV